MGSKELFEHRDVAEGYWRMICDVEYVGVIPEEAAEPIADGTRLQRDFPKLLNTVDQSDFAFVVQAETIKAHKNILMARCSYFESMFQSRMNESVSNLVNISDIRPDVFREMLKFLYSGQKSEFQNDVPMDLLFAADKYGLDDLTRICETEISHYLTAENVIDALILAESCNCTELMASASAVFRSQARDLKKSNQWTKFSDSPTLLLKLLEFFCD